VDITIPEDLSTVEDPAELNTILEALIAEFDALHDAGSTDIVALTEIADSVDAIRTELAARNEAATAAADKIAELAGRVRATEADEVAEAADDITAEAPAEAETEERELVTASALTPKAPSARAVRRHVTLPDAPAKTDDRVTILAAADIPGVSASAELSLLDVAKAMHAKARTLSDGSARVPVAKIDIPSRFSVGADLAHNLDVLAQATDTQSLVAAGGWCAPSENLYSMFGIDAGDGLIDLPTVRVTRGGLNVPSFFDIGDAAGALWTWTEADDEAAHDPSSPEGSKPCLRIPCPEFTDYRLVAEGLCITNGNLTDRAFPELTQRFVSLAINAHLHRLSAAVIADIIAGSTGVTVTSPVGSASGDILNAIDLQVADYRSQYRMATNAVLEAVFPLWVREALRADFAFRDAAGYSNVTDAMIADHFAARHVRVQFVHDYQPLYGMAAATAWPATLDFLLYPAGGFVRGDGGTIDLGIVRDSVLNATNDYTAAWTEQLYLVAQLGPNAREVTVTLSVNGATGCCEVPAEV
jgi:hypothetical protein